MKSFFLILLIISINTQKIIDIDYIDQTKDYPTGCESVSTVMCLRYHKIDITVDEFIDNYLDKGDMYFKGNKRYAPDPNVKFVGSPYDSHSYGCYEPVIEKALNKIITSENLNNFEVKNLNEVPMENLISDYIDKDFPVIFWATINFVPSEKGGKWFVPETEKEFQWISHEHYLLLVGYNEIHYIFNDPWDNHGVIGYEKKLVEQRHKEEYSMAVAIVKKE